MSEPYSIDAPDAVYLIATLHGKPMPERSNADLKNLLFQTLKLAESVCNNCKDWLELAAIVHADIHPHSAEKLNTPTLMGALSSAVTVPRVDTTNCCITCAFRVGSVANQTEAVAEDVMNALLNKEMFLCHHCEGEPTKPCRGFIEATKANE